MFEAVNRSGFGGAGYGKSVALSEAPSDRAVADILTGTPCRTCAYATAGCTTDEHAACTSRWSHFNRAGHRIA